MPPPPEGARGCAAPLPVALALRGAQHGRRCRSAIVAVAQAPARPRPPPPPLVGDVIPSSRRAGVMAHRQFQSAHARLGGRGMRVLAWIVVAM